MKVNADWIRSYVFTTTFMYGKTVTHDYNIAREKQHWFPTFEEFNRY